MVQSIELLLDDRTEAAVRASWDALVADALPSLATTRSDSNRPHITLAAADGGLEPALDAVRAVLRGWDLARAGLGATLGQIVLFGGHRHRWVLARPVVATKGLLALHDAVHAAIERTGADAAISEHTRPGAWTPHVSLARRIPAERLGPALDLLEPEPLRCRLVAARFWDSEPAEVTPLP